MTEWIAEVRERLYQPPARSYDMILGEKPPRDDEVTSPGGASETGEETPRAEGHRSQALESAHEQGTPLETASEGTTPAWGRAHAEATSLEAGNTCEESRGLQENAIP